MLSVIAPCVMDGETPAPVSFPTSGMALVELPTVLLSGIASGTDDFSVCGTQAAERTAKRHILPHLYGRGHRSPLHLGAAHSHPRFVISGQFLYAPFARGALDKKSSRRIFEVVVQVMIKPVKKLI